MAFAGGSFFSERESVRLAEDAANQQESLTKDPPLAQVPDEIERGLRVLIDSIEATAADMKRAVVEVIPMMRTTRQYQTLVTSATSTTANRQTARALLYARAVALKSQLDAELRLSSQWGSASVPGSREVLERKVGAVVSVLRMCEPTETHIDWLEGVGADSGSRQAAALM